ncbi:unnamed protein product [Prorocentrum cordatum]|uniref:Uncharacterized protein n=1 Tax=Prorocentrum cordatum TaxID=2364126 RepID=A0ABN9SNI8_9DINO|nr:unnamed protein product [Polarella glacialis]
MSALCALTRLRSRRRLRRIAHPQLRALAGADRSGGWTARPRRGVAGFLHGAGSSQLGADSIEAHAREVDLATVHQRAPVTHKVIEPRQSPSVSVVVGVRYRDLEIRTEQAAERLRPGCEDGGDSGDVDGDKATLAAAITINTLHKVARIGSE